MWPMLAGVGPVLGDGEAGAFVRPGGQRTGWGYREADGVAVAAGGAVQARPEAPPYRLRTPGPAVAVLTGPQTASSGEFVLLAFRGRPATRSFGEPTAGVPTANQAKRLGDGAELNLTTALGADRTGRTYDQALPPDEAVATDWTRIESPGEDEPVLAAALAWLRAGPCS